MISKKIVELSLGAALLSVVILPAASGQSVHVRIPLSVIDRQGHKSTVFFGLDSDATECVDASLGEFELPPDKCGGADCCLYLTDADGNNDRCLGPGVLLDLRPYVSPSQMDVYRVNIAAQNYPLTFRWPGGLGVDFYSLKMSVTEDGSNPIADMLLVDSLHMETPITNQLILFAWGPKPVVNRVPERRTVPSEWSLQQNYPNPFNPSTSIRFNVPTAGSVALRVYNMLGETVTTLLDEYTQPGEYTVSWDALGVPSGVYYYRLQTPSQMFTKKMAVMH